MDINSRGDVIRSIYKDRFALLGICSGDEPAKLR